MQIDGVQAILLNPLLKHPPCPFTCQEAGCIHYQVEDPHAEYVNCYHTM